MPSYTSTHKGAVIDATISAVIAGQAGLQGIRVNGVELIPDAQNKVDITAGVVQVLNKTATLASDSWVGDSAPYTQTVSVSGILSTDNPIVDVSLSSTYATAKEQLEAWNKVSNITTSNGSITASCFDDKPTVSIPIQLKVIR